MRDAATKIEYERGTKNILSSPSSVCACVCLPVSFLKGTQTFSLGPANELPQRVSINFVDKQTETKAGRGKVAPEIIGFPSYVYYAPLAVFFLRVTPRGGSEWMP